MPPSPPWAPFPPWAPYPPYAYTARTWVQLPQRGMLSWPGAALLAASLALAFAYYLYCCARRAWAAR